MRHPRRGFTLIELMIVVVIIAVIAAIAIPGLLRSQRSSHERNASASLRTLSTAQEDFRTNDRDGNMVRDYWTRDVAGLYALCPNSVADPIKLIELSVAGADAEPLGVGAVAAGTEPAMSTFINSQPKGGYWYIALTSDETGAAYAQNTSGAAPLGALAYYHTTRFAAMCFPDSRNVGQYSYWVSETHTIFRRGIVGGYVRPPGQPPGGGNNPLNGQLLGASPTNQWPTELQLQADYAKID